MTRTRCLLITTCVIALLLLTTPQLFAQTCVKDEYGKNVQCTANDVRIASVTNTRNLDGSPITTCNIGTRISFVATYHVVTSSTSSRSNIGLYFAKDSQADAISGSCYDNIIPPGHPSLNAFCTAANTPFPFCTGAGTGTSSATLGSSNYTELDNPNLASAPDNCGDSNASSSQDVDVLVQDVLCEPTSLTDPHLRLPNCTTWQVPGQTILCESPSPTYPWVPAAVPGTPSKCNCGVLQVPIIVQHAALAVTKTANPTSQTGTDGGPVNYTVVIENNSNLGGVTVNQLCDDKYGNIKTAVTSPAQGACAAGTLCTASVCTGVGTPYAYCTGAGTGTAGAGSTCASNITCDLPASLAAPGDFVTCTFAGQIPENSTITDTVTANGVDGANNPVSGNAQATASAGDAPSSATTTKSAVGATQACVTVRYGVDVKNTSGGDETITLSGFSDSAFGSITSLHGDAATNNSVLGTTCGVDTALGTFSGAGAGAFSKTLAANAEYTCQFDAVICSSTLTNVTKPDNTQCFGFQHSNTITPTLAGDDTPPEIVSNTGGSLTVTECIGTFTP